MTENSEGAKSRTRTLTPEQLAERIGKLDPDSLLELGSLVQRERPRSTALLIEGVENEKRRPRATTDEPMRGDD